MAISVVYSYAKKGIGTSKSRMQRNQGIIKWAICLQR